MVTRTNSRKAVARASVVRWVAYFPWAGLATMIVFGVAQHSVKEIAYGEKSRIEVPEEYIGTAVDPRIIRRFLGIRLAVADLIWIDTIIKADIKREAKPFTTFYLATKTIAALDPDNLYVYYVAGLYLSVIKDDIKGATAILRAGAQYMEMHPYTWPDAWRVPFTLGYNLLFEENEIDEGSKWIERAATMPGAPALVLALGKRVSTDQGRLEVASKVLTDLHRRVRTPQEKKRVEAKMTEVAVKQELIELNEKFKSFLETTGAYAFPRPRQLDLFLRSVHHSGRDILGRPLAVGPMGRIETKVK